jgi:hypothetical protein
MSTTFQVTTRAINPRPLRRDVSNKNPLMKAGPNLTLVMSPRVVMPAGETVVGVCIKVEATNVGVQKLSLVLGTSLGARRWVLFL